MIDVEMQGLLRLVRNALCDEAEPISEQCDIETVVELAGKHQVEMLAYDGAKRCGYDKNHPAIRALFAKCCKAAVKSDLQMTELQKLYAAFDEAHVDYMPLKGCIMKAMYPGPEFRAMNDADILIRPEQYEKTTKVIMERLGYNFLAESDCELKWCKKGLYAELHKRLIPSFIKDFYGYFGDGWSLAEKQSGTRYAMSRENEFLFIFTHFARHYREGGVGIRHMTDLWLYRRNNPQMQEEIILAALKTLSLETFYVNILMTLKNWFEGGEETETTALMTDYIKNSGSFGNQENRHTAQSLRKTKGKGTWGAVLHTIFPSVNNMQYAYPVLKKWPVLLPVMWVYRWCKVLFGHREKLRKQKFVFRKTDVKKMDAFEQNMRAVGLSMEFKGE